jgi:glycosyltransferase involved in cell wall biosynthesis
MMHIVVMVTTSYPRFPGDSVGTFLEPMAKSVAARGHEVHVVAPWHPLVRRGPIEDGVRFHFYRYAPIRALNVFGYASAMHADVRLRASAYLAAPLALACGWRAARRIARRHRATMMHGHWVIPGGFVASIGAPAVPLVVSLHGSDVFVAERVAAAGRAARSVFRRAGAITASSEDLARRAVALGADPRRVVLVPYGVDTVRFRPRPYARAHRREALGVSPDAVLVFAAGRLVRKKGFEYLIDALPLIHGTAVVLAIAGQGDLAAELRERARAARVGERVRFLGNLAQDDVGTMLAAADVVVAPSVHDDRGNVDGLPNVVLEALASGTPLVTTPAGGIGSVVTHGRTGLIVPEKDPASLAKAIEGLARNPQARARLGEAGRALVAERFGWNATAERLEAAYARALANKFP